MILGGTQPTTPHPLNNTLRDEIEKTSKGGWRQSIGGVEPAH